MKTIGEVVKALTQCGIKDGCEDCPYAKERLCSESAISDATEYLKKLQAISDGEPWKPLETQEPQETQPSIKDSGERTQYSTGAVRDCKEGKGRCDLMPLDILDGLIDPLDKEGTLWSIDQFRRLGIPQSLIIAIRHFAFNQWHEEKLRGLPCLLLEVSKHFEAGAKKYGENNWQKGIPVHSYIDSAVRHYLKYRAGWTDEPHDRAFVWNLLCCIWTVQHHPELDDFTEKGKNRNAEK